MIDWMYHRKGWLSCVKAQGFLEGSGLQVKSVTDAKKEKKGPAEALALAKTAATVIVARGKKVVTIDMADPPPDAELTALLLGPSGNLRAPTLRKGKTLYVGFSADLYRELAG